MRKLRLFLTISALCWVPMGSSRAIDFAQEPLLITTANNEYRYQVEIANTPEQQEQGLMFRTTLGDNAGMLFPQGHERMVRMWMKNTKIPLDMLFIDTTGKIVYIAANTTPDSLDIISSPLPVYAVLELAGGSASKRKIEVGNRVLHKAFKP